MTDNQNIKNKGHDSGPVDLETEIILSFVREGSSVLDLGCGEGKLLALLVERKKCNKARGIEIDERSIYECVAKGLSVLHGDIDSGLADYSDKSFDYVILKECLQQVKSPNAVLKESLRIGREVIVSFPNFANYFARCQMFFTGKTPVTPSLPFEWHDTPNLHFLSISDFFDYCRRRGIQIRKTAFTTDGHRVRILPNLFGAVGIFVLSNA